MTALAQVAQQIRTKNAGPFWLTVDIFCGDAESFARVSAGIETAAVADRFSVQAADIQRFDIADLQVVKLSLPRPTVQGSIADRDMHGAGYAFVLSDLDIA